MICGDVSGHGPNPAALGAMLRASWQALCESGVDPLTIVESLKAVLVRERRSPDSFATLCLAWIDPARDEIRVLNLGHPVPLLIAGEVRSLEAQPTPPLGTIDWPIGEPTVIALPDQWQLLFYTDGLIEGRLSPGSHERYGERRLVESLQVLACERIDGACIERLISAIEAGSGRAFEDDVAVMLISKTEPVDMVLAALGPAAKASD